MLYLVVGIGVLSAGGLTYLLIRARQELHSLRARFAPVVDADAEAQRVKAEAADIRRSAESEREKGRRDADAFRQSGEKELQAVRVEIEATRKGVDAELDRVRSETTALRDRYASGKAKFDSLNGEIMRLEENLESIEVGMYRPHFTYEDSESYKRAIESIRDQQKAMIKAGKATIRGTTWTVGGSAREGERMVKQNEKVILRAFNSESEAAVANVTWQNHSVMAARINKACEVLNKSASVLQITIAPEYVVLRLTELQLVFESAEKKQAEREEQRRIRAEQREEEKVQRELDREREEAAKEEAADQKALLKAQKQLEALQDAERDAMLAKIAELEAHLVSARDRKERAMAQAELTKVGHVYVISNLGAFGEGVIKIGMTRRLDPIERVQELGDASVPFPFDVHALIYSENAPELESKLHEHFWERRVNWANDRKEFFRVSVAEVQSGIRTLGLQSELAAVAEAKEYRQTLAALAALESNMPLAESGSTFPDDPFA